MSKLDARVRAVNKVNQMAKELLPKLQEAVKPFLGQKIIKADKSLTVKIKQVIDPLLPPYTNRLNVSHYLNEYSLAFSIYGNEDYENRSYSHKTTIYVGKIVNGVLTELETQCGGYKSDYTAEEIVERRKQYQIAKAEADRTQALLHPFGEYEV